MDRIKLTLFITLFTFGLSYGQVNRYMVFFSNKTGTPHSISSPETFLSERAILRRDNQNIAVIEQDLPVTPAYVEDVRNAGATVLYKTKWMNGVLVECDQSLILTIEALPDVSSVELVAPGARPPSAGRMGSSGKFKEVKESTGATDIQLSMLGIDEMHTAGYRGEGKLIAVIDAGYPGANTAAPFQHIFNESRFDATTSYNFVSGGSNVFTGNSHGTHVWAIMGAFSAGEFIGGAYKASFILFITEHTDTEYRVEEYNWLFAAERADSAGVDMINTSLGYNTFDDAQMDYDQSQMDGQTTVITRAANMASLKGIAVVVSAGNEGNKTWGIITAPADSENVLAVGSVDAAGVKVVMSSTGPTADGRIKPDVVALGDDVSYISPAGSVSSGDGTSYASPLIASFAAGIWQMLPELSAQQLLDTIRNRASQFSNPDNFLGYGIPNFISVITAVAPEIPADVASVFPNPVVRYAKVQFMDIVQSDHVLITLIDSRGMMSKMSASQVTNRELQIDLSNQKPGLYLLRLQTGNQLSVHKILKIE
jgi:serine protease AprX